MKNRETLTNLETAKQAIQISFEIQNKGIGTSFQYGHGHTQEIEINIHIPCWGYPGATIKEFRVYLSEGEKYTERNIKAIEKLTELLNTDPGSMRNDFDEMLRQKRFEQYQQLKSEFENQNAA